jgi:hypothetical protein
VLWFTSHDTFSARGTPLSLNDCKGYKARHMIEITIKSQNAKPVPQTKLRKQHFDRARWNDFTVGFCCVDLSAIYFEGVPDVEFSAALKE